MSEIHLDDLQHVVIDNVTVGDVTSAMANYLGQSSEIQAALVAWHQSAVDAAIAAAMATATETLNAVIIERDQAKADLVAMAAERNANIADNENLRQAQALYLTNTDAAKSALQEMVVSMWTAQRDACVAKLAEICSG